MDSATNSCNVNFTMRILECEGFSTPDMVNIKEEQLDISDNLEERGKDDDNTEIRETIKEEIGNDDDDPQLEKQSVSDWEEKFQSRPPDEQILTHPEKALLELNRNQYPLNRQVFDFNAEQEKNIILQSQSKLPNEVDSKCVDCNSDFRRKVLQSHSSLDNKENAFKCGHCNKEPNTTGIVPKNAVKRSRTKTYKIDIKCCHCNQIFLHKSRLDEHLLIHKHKTLTPSCVKENETFECSKCDKTFSKKSLLARHNRIHSRIKPFECHYCNKRFRRTKYLKQHIRTHTGEKPYKCKQCNLKYTFASSLSRHIHHFHLIT